MCVFVFIAVAGVYLFLFLLFPLTLHFEHIFLNIQDYFFYFHRVQVTHTDMQTIFSPLGSPMTSLSMPQNRHDSEMPPQISSFIQNFILEFHVGGIIQNR